MNYKNYKYNQKSLTVDAPEGALMGETKEGRQMVIVAVFTARRTERVMYDESCTEPYSSDRRVH